MRRDRHQDRVDGVNARLRRGGTTLTFSTTMNLEDYYRILEGPKPGEPKFDLTNIPVRAR